jgi:hypothetical protein
MKKLLVILLFICFAIPTVVGATLWDYYSSKGQPLPSIKDRASIAASYGIYDYSGTAEENNLLESFLRMSLGAGNPVTATDWTLARRLTSSASDTTIYLTSIKDLRNNSIATSSLPYKVYLMIEAENSDNAEIVVCPRSGYDQSNKKFTSCTRGLSFYGNSESSDSDNIKEHSSGVSANMTNVGQFYNLFGGIWDDNFWYGLNTFASTTEATSQINIGTTTQAYFKNEGGVLYYCNNGASCAAIGSGANTYSFIRPLYNPSGSNIGLATSTSDFVLDGSGNLSIRKNNSITSNADGLAVATTSDYTWTGNHTFNGEITSNATTTLKNATTTGSLYVGGDLAIGGKTLFAVKNTDTGYSDTSGKYFTLWSITIPANTIGANGLLHFYAAGFVNEGDASPRTLALKWNGETLASSTNLNVRANLSWAFDFNFWNKGATNSQFGEMIFTYNNGLTNTGVLTSFDTSVAGELSLVVGFGNQNAVNSATTSVGLIEIKR